MGAQGKRDHLGHGLLCFVMTRIPSMCILEKSTQPLLQKHKTIFEIANKLHSSNVAGKAKSDQGFSSIASPSNGKISVNCPADPENQFYD